MNIPEFRPLPCGTAEQLVAAFEAGVRFVMVQTDMRIEENRLQPTVPSIAGARVSAGTRNGTEFKFKPSGVWVTEAHKAAPTTYLAFADQQPTKPEADEDGWIEWGGGACPVPPDTLVDVRLRHDGGIVAYRIVKSATEKAELGYHKGVPRESLAEVIARKRRELAPVLEASMPSLRCTPDSDRAGIDRFRCPAGTCAEAGGATARLDAESWLEVAVIVLEPTPTKPTHHEVIGMAIEQARRLVAQAVLNREVDDSGRAALESLEAAVIEWGCAFAQTPADRAAFEREHFADMDRGGWRMPT